MAEGNVYSQNPPGNALAKPGASVDLVISTGPCPIPAPDVVSLALFTATTDVTSAGLVLGTVAEQYHASIPADQVIGQEPAAGAIAAPGSPVDLAVSLGLEIEALAVDFPDPNLEAAVRNAIKKLTNETLMDLTS
jgi:beta-lactam-binding protein with PASTA domain